MHIRTYICGFNAKRLKLVDVHTYVCIPTSSFELQVCLHLSAFCSFRASDFRSEDHFRDLLVVTVNSNSFRKRAKMLRHKRDS